MFQPQGINSLLKDGGKSFAGVDEALLKNIAACKELAQIVRSSFGPNGCNKLVINHLGKHFVTSDTATMLKEMEVEHPCGKLMVQAAAAQEFECGDATNLAVMFAGSLLAEAEELLKEGLHASDIVRGYDIALKKTMAAIDKMDCWTLTDLKDEAQIKKAIRTAIGAKQRGLEDQLSDLVGKAIVQVTRANKGEFNMDNVRSTKLPGGSLNNSFVVDGMVIPRAPLGTETTKKNCKVAVYGNGVEFQATEAKGTVLLENAEQLMEFSKGEEASMERQIAGLAEMGVGMVISGGAIHELALHFMDKYKILVIKISSKFELQRFCKSLKAINVIRAGLPMEEELGQVESINVEEYGSLKVTVFRTSESKISTIVLRGATANQLEEWDRAINDGVSVIRCAAKSGKFCAGGAATEIRLAKEITSFGQTVPGLDQYAVLKFAEALEIVPKILSDNVGKKGRVETLTSLYEAQETGSPTIGMDLELENEGLLQDSKQLDVLDHLDSKKWAIKHALDTVLTVLRVDHIIMAKAAGGPKGG